MYPVLRDDDLVVMRETEPESLRPGNIVVYLSGGQYIIHRMIRRGKENRFYLKGDGYNLPPVEASAAAIVGKAVGFIRGGRYRPMRRSRELHSWLVSSLKQLAKRCLRGIFLTGSAGRA